MIFTCFLLPMLKLPSGGQTGQAEDWMQCSALNKLEERLGSCPFSAMVPLASEQACLGLSLLKIKKARLASIIMDGDSLSLALCNAPLGP